MASKGVSGFMASPACNPSFLASVSSSLVSPTSTWTVQPLAPAFRERLEVVARVRHHQVAVEENAGVLSERFDDRRPDGEVGHEMGVHDVHMEPIGLRGNGSH